MKKGKLSKVITALLLGICLTTSMLPSTSRAYTEEQIAQAKAWLAAHGYSADRGGAAQAYQDYLNGKYNADGTENTSGSTTGTGGSSSGGTSDDEWADAEVEEAKAKKKAAKNTWNQIFQDPSTTSADQNSIAKNTTESADNTKSQSNLWGITAKELKTCQSNLKWTKTLETDDYVQYVQTTTSANYTLKEPVQTTTLAQFIFSKSDGLMAIVYTKTYLDEKSLQNAVDTQVQSHESTWASTESIETGYYLRGAWADENEVVAIGVNPFLIWNPTMDAKTWKQCGEQVLRCSPKCLKKSEDATIIWIQDLISQWAK